MADTARNGFNITPSDDTTVAFDALRVGGAGDVTLLDRDGTSVVVTCGADAHILLQGTKVMATGTTATNIVGLRL